MRMIYTSPRHENVDRVAAIFAEHGIASRVINDGGWRGRDHRRFSYVRGSRQHNWPQVWVLEAEDQPKARAILHEIGIKPAVRFGEELDSERGGGVPLEASRRALVNRVRLILLVAVAVVALLALVEAW